MTDTPQKTRVLRWDRFRIWLVLRLFPVRGLTRCANRLEWRYPAPAADITLGVRYRSQPDGYSFEEMFKITETFLGKKPTAEQWQTILNWRMS